MKFLFFGGGVLGSLYAAKLATAGEDVAVLAAADRASGRAGRDDPEWGPSWLLLARLDAPCETRDGVLSSNEWPLG